MYLSSERDQEFGSISDLWMSTSSLERANTSLPLFIMQVEGEDQIA